MVQRLGDSENLIGDLLRVKTNLEKAKMTAETRLYNRLKRPADENCKDSAQLRYWWSMSFIHKDEINLINRYTKTILF